MTGTGGGTPTRLRTGLRRSLAPALAAAVTVTAVLVARDVDDADPPADSAPGPPVSTPAQPEVSTDDFCQAFDGLARAHADRVSGIGDGSLAPVEAAARQVLTVGDDIAMPPDARRGLAYVVGDLVPTSAPQTDEDPAVVTDRMEAFNAYLALTCQPGT